MQLTKKQVDAIERIIAKTPPRQRDFAGETQVTYHDEDDGVIITNGYVLVHAPESLGFRGPKKPDPKRDDRLNHCAHAAFDSQSCDFYIVDTPFKMEKVASTLRKQLKKHEQRKDMDGNAAIAVSAATPDGRIMRSAFACDQVIDAFEAVGKDAVGYVGMSDLFHTPMPYMLVEPAGNVGNFKAGIHAIVMPVRLQ